MSFYFTENIFLASISGNRQKNIKMPNTNSLKAVITTNFGLNSFQEINYGLLETKIIISLSSSDQVTKNISKT